MTTLIEILTHALERKVTALKATANRGKIRNVLHHFATGKSNRSIVKVLRPKYPDLSETAVKRIIILYADKEIKNIRTHLLRFPGDLEKQVRRLSKREAIERQVESGKDWKEIETELEVIPMSEQLEEIQRPEPKTIKVLGEEYAVTPEEAIQGKEPKRARLDGRYGRQSSSGLSRKELANLQRRETKKLPPPLPVEIQRSSR